jgi:hypothetical protein
MHPYIFKKVSVRERSPRVGLKVAYPGLWVAGYVTKYTIDRSHEQEVSLNNISERFKKNLSPLMSI